VDLFLGLAGQVSLGLFITFFSVALVQLALFVVSFSVGAVVSVSFFAAALLLGLVSWAVSCLLSVLRFYTVFHVLFSSHVSSWARFLV